eukprot:TRINITY_DN30156_c0_g1_i4.p2 TRINITY_DN30156_c0_g1~~TRINITY_DN30156_c0_g1_i4.p2  ORF type:complete len:122 (-),score=13.37 TRINITY_DN30156_c0_g1_i4:249-614(-)
MQKSAAAPAGGRRRADSEVLAGGYIVPAPPTPNIDEARACFMNEYSPRPYMLGHRTINRAENGFGRTESGGFALRETSRPLTSYDYHKAFRSKHPDERATAEPDTPGPGFRRTQCGGFWRS